MSSFMQILYGILYGISLVFMMLTMFMGIPKALNWWELNMSKDYLERRAEIKVREIRSKIRVIELEQEAVKLDKKLSDLSFHE